MTSAHTLTPEDITRWKNLSTEAHSFFQTCSWNQFLSDIYSYPDYTLTIGGEKDNYAFLPLKLVKSRLLGNRLISTPFSDHAGPTETKPENQKLLLKAASEYCRRLKCDFLEIRLDRSQSSKLYPDLGRLGFMLAREYCSFLIDLRDGEEKTWDRISPSTRRAVAKSERATIQVREAKTRSDVQEYHKLHLISSREHGSPAHPLEFFTELHRSLSPDGQMKLLIASHKESGVAGLLLLRHGTKVHYWQSALPSQYRAFNPFHLLLWEALAGSIEEGCESFDLGRTREHTGVYRFKQTWGGIEYRLDHYCLFKKKPLKLVDPEDLKYRAASAVWKRIPKVVLERMESRIIREIAL